MAALPPPAQSDIRWKQRFDNLQRAYQRLRWALEIHQQDPDNDLIRMAVIKAYEFTFELSWKTSRISSPTTGSMPSCPAKYSNRPSRRVWSLMASSGSTCWKSAT